MKFAPCIATYETLRKTPTLLCNSPWRVYGLLYFNLQPATCKTYLPFVAGSAWSKSFGFVECPTTSQCLLKLSEHSVAIHYFPSAFFASSSFAIFTILNDNNSQLKLNSKFHKNDRFSTQNIRNLFVKSFSKQRYCGDTLSILCVKIFEANCANILGNPTEIKRVSTKHWSPVIWPPTDPLLTPLLAPLLTPYKINGKMKNYQWFINKFSLPETSKMAVALQIFRLPSHLTEGFVTENRAQHKIEHHQIVLLYALGNEAKRNADKWTGSRKDRDGLFDGLLMDCSCHEHARKPQPEDEFVR